MHSTSSHPATSYSTTATSLSPVTPPHSPDQRPTERQRPLSQASLDSALSSRSHREYLDSLVVPTEQEFDHIAQVQLEREAEQKRRQHQKHRQSLEATRTSHLSSSPQPDHPRHGSLSTMFGFGRHTNTNEDGLRSKAATVIQRNYRGYRSRREIKGLGLDASTRWVHAVREAQWREMTTPRARADLAADALPSLDRPGTATSGQPGSRSSTARLKWKKVSTIARHAGGDVDADTSSSSSSSSSSDSESSDDRKSKGQKALERKRKEEAKARRKQESRMMGLQYFLEMVDLKHRYGANLRVYHEEWKRAETNENFFYWLDYGEGRDLDIEACPRERLDREQVRYLSREERQYYLVTVDDQGRLCWAKNGARIDTTEKWKDSIHGIVPSDDPTPAHTPVSDNHTTLLGDTTTDSAFSSRPTSASSSNSSVFSADAARYTTPSITSPTKKISHHLSGATIFNKLLRKTVRKNTWIFVADTSFRLYVGLKNSGAFQHSSFLQGSRISAAGLIRISNGRLTSLSPLSGHYRPPASNFRAFVKSLKEEGVDMGRVSVSKSYAVLVGLEMYIKARKKAEDVVGRVKRHGHSKKEGAEVVVPEPGPEQAPPIIHAGGEEETQQHHHNATMEGEKPQYNGTTAHANHTEQQKEEKQRKEEEEMRQENRLAVEVMQKLNLGTGLTEPKGQKGGSDVEGEEGAATALSPPHSHLHS